MPNALEPIVSRAEKFSQTYFDRDKFIIIIKFLILKKYAFTLAEVLITLGIIGVVAALTLPSLIADYQEKVLVSQAKKSYSIIMNAINLYLADNVSSGDYRGLFVPNKSDDEIMAEFSKYFNVIKFYKSSEIVANNDVRYPVKLTKAENNGQGKNQIDYAALSSAIVLNDGSIISLHREAANQECSYVYTTCDKDADGNFIMNGDECQKSEHTGLRCGQIRIDINGKKSPNRIGSDVFTMLVLPNRIEYYQSSGDFNYILNYNKIQPYTDYSIGGDFKN